MRRLMVYQVVAVNTDLRAACGHPPCNLPGSGEGAGQPARAEGGEDGDGGGGGGCDDDDE